MLFFFLPAWNPASWGWERALKQDASLAVSSSISHYREFWGWQGAITHTGKVPPAIASLGTALLIGSSLAWRDCNFGPFLWGKVLHVHCRWANFQYAVFRACTSYPAVLSACGKLCYVHLGFCHFCWLLWERCSDLVVAKRNKIKHPFPQPQWNHKHGVLASDSGLIFADCFFWRAGIFLLKIGNLIVWEVYLNSIL